MTDSPPADPVAQLDTWRSAVEALGGQHATARALGMSPRSVSRLYWGTYPLHEGILTDTSLALIHHANVCQRLERQLSPAYMSNLTEHQRKNDKRGRHLRGTGGKADV